MTVGSLFSGIGGFERGLRAALGDLEVAWLCDNAEFPRRVLSARFPDVRLYGDSTEVDASAPDVELLVAGFPCQPVSQAGLKYAQLDTRWLWPEVARVVAAKRPLLVVIENVRGLLGRGLRDVLQDLARLGYDAQWDTISAFAVGAPHIRERVWIVASREPLGRVFARRPRVVGDWIGNEPRPRLALRAPYQSARLEALGNAVVPQLVTHVAVSAVAALATDPWEPPATLSEVGLRVEEELGRKLRPAGALVDGRVYGLASSSPRPRRRRLWPSPAANEAAWSLEALLACRDAAGRRPPADLLKRWYHPETGQIVQTGLYAVVQAVESGLWSEPDGRPGPWLRTWLLPTPAAADGHRGPDYARATRNGSGGDDLVTAVARAEGTPKRLDPRWVEWMMGLPLGWTNPDEEVPHVT